VKARFKVLHVPFTFFPDSVGGTEIYVEALAQELTKLGTTNLIAAPHTETITYEHNDLKVCRFEITSILNDLAVLYGDGDPIAEASFDALLTREQPDIVHLHAFTSAISLRTALAIKRRGIPLVFTYHTPTVTCARGTLMRLGKEICDGKLDERLCTQCLLDKHGVGYPINALLAALPPTVSALGNQHQGGIWTALRMRSLIHVKHEATRHFLTEMDRIVVLCRWTQDLLAGNGIPPAKMVLSPHGLTVDAPVVTPFALPPTPIKLAFFGRIDPVKGIDIVIRALRGLTTAPLSLDIYGVTQPGMEAYRDELVHLVADDERVVFRDPIPNHQIITQLREYHFLVVPSQGLETGPLVVLEAFAADIPVIGSDLGGIAELVKHNVDGLLVESGSPARWTESFTRILEDNTLHTRLKAGIQPPRTMVDVAHDMLSIYTALVR